VNVMASLQRLLGLPNRNDQEFGESEQDRLGWNPDSPRAGEDLKINYRGQLLETGAPEVYLHYGFDGWQNPREVRMERRSDGAFTAEIYAEGNDEVNLCFRDAIGNWDNNSGQDWTLGLHS
jgi:hypothetical protein